MCDGCLNDDEMSIQRMYYAMGETVVPALVFLQAEFE